MSVYETLGGPLRRLSLWQLLTESDACLMTPPQSSSDLPQNCLV